MAGASVMASAAVCARDAHMPSRPSCASRRRVGGCGCSLLGASPLEVGHDDQILVDGNEWAFEILHCREDFVIDLSGDRGEGELFGALRECGDVGLFAVHADCCSK